MSAGQWVALILVLTFGTGLLLSILLYVGMVAAGFFGIL